MIIDLPAGPYQVRSSGGYSPGPAPLTRRLLAAAHVVADPLGDNTPGSPAAVDWDGFFPAYRHV